MFLDLGQVGGKTKCLSPLAVGRKKNWYIIV